MISLLVSLLVNVHWGKLRHPEFAPPPLHLHVKPFPPQGSAVRLYKKLLNANIMLDT